MVSSTRRARIDVRSQTKAFPVGGYAYGDEIELTWTACEKSPARGEAKIEDNRNGNV